MNFFHKLAQIYLVHHFNEVVYAARKSDEGYLGFGRFFRDQKLSQAKQAIGTDVIGQLLKLDEASLRVARSELAEAISEDELSAHLFSNLIDSYDGRVGEKIKECDPRNKGASVTAVEDAKQLLANIRGICREVGLEDKPYNETDPLSLFQYYMALYVCSKLRCADTLGAKKADAVKVSMRDTADVYGDMTDLSRQLKVIRHAINELKLVNEKLCNEHPAGLDVPLNFVGIWGLSLSPKFVPSVGTLQTSLEEVEKKIAALERRFAAAAREDASSMTEMTSRATTPHAFFPIESVAPASRRSSLADSASSSPLARSWALTESDEAAAPAPSM